MTIRPKKDKRKEKDYCEWCSKVILEQLGAWVHADTGKPESDTPIRHTAYPKSRKKSK